MAFLLFSIGVFNGDKIEIYPRASIGPLVHNNTGSVLLMQLLNSCTSADTITGTSIGFV